MNYFKIKPSTDPEIVGKPSFQSIEMVEGYDYGAADSIYHWQNSKLEPNLKSVLILDEAKLTDLISCVPASGGQIISKRFLSVLECFNIMSYAYAEAELVHKKKKYSDYVFFYLKCSLNDEEVEFDESIYVRQEFDANWNILEKDRLNIRSFREVKEIAIKNKPPVLKKLLLKSDFTYDVFKIPFISGIVVTEPVKVLSEKEGIKGVNFEPLPNIQRK